MSGSWLVDALLVVALISYGVFGYRLGLLRTAGAIAGVVLGAVVALLMIPLVSSWIPQPNWRIGVVLAVAILLLVGGHAAGLALGNSLQRVMKRVGLSVVDRIFGAVLSAIVAALVASMLAVSIGSLGVPFLTPAIASSVVLRTIDRLTPNPAKAALAQLRSLVTSQGIPTIVDALGLPTGPHTPPSFATDTAALNRAANSVVKITGNAYACGQSQSGSGWIVAHDRILTNAHVVAGVSQPVVEVAGVGAVNGRVVYFDPVGDLAIIAAPGIDTPALTLSTTLPAGSLAVAEGFPFGGPYTALPAKVLSIDTVKVADIYGHNGADREIYALDANVQQGDSGGPLLTRAGQVVGVVFAKSATAHNIGYALTMASVAPLASKASTLTNRVSSGTCTKG